jgi:hypothetical protein
VWIVLLIGLSAVSTGFIIYSMLDDPVASASMLVTTRKDDAVRIGLTLSRYREAVINMNDQELDDLLDEVYTNALRQIQIQ